MPPSRPLGERFWDKVQRAGEDDCWMWTGARHRFGYGRIGVGAPSRATETAHRVSWVLHFGPIPSGKHVLHHCDNPPCVNPRHLFLGDQAANVADMWAKGRGRITHRRGEAHPWSKFTAEEVAEIRASAEPAGSIARRFGVSREAVYRIRRGLNWREEIA